MAVDPYTQVFRSMYVPCIKAVSEGAGVVFNDRLAIPMKSAWQAKEEIGNGVGGAFSGSGVLAFWLRNAPIHDSHWYAIFVYLHDGPGGSCEEWVIELAWGES